MTGASRGLMSTEIGDQVRELTGLVNHARTAKPLLHAHLDPEPGQAWSEDAASRFWSRFEVEHRLEGRPFASVFHTKHGRRHEHRVYAGIDDLGRKIKLSHDKIAREYICRLTEFEEGHPLRKGKHNLAVFNRAVRDGRQDFAAAIEAAGMLDGKRAIARMTPEERLQQERTSISIEAVRAAALSAYRQADNGAAFRAALEACGLRLAQGEKQVLLIDQSGSHHGLNRVLASAARQDGSDPIRAADSRALLAGVVLPALAEVKEAGPLRDPFGFAAKLPDPAKMAVRSAPSPRLGTGAEGQAASTSGGAPAAFFDIFDDRDEMAAAKALKRASDAERNRRTVLASVSRSSSNTDAVDAARVLAERLFKGGQNGRTHPIRTQAPVAIHFLRRLRALPHVSHLKRLEPPGRDDLLRAPPRPGPRAEERRVHNDVHASGGRRGEERSGLTPVEKRLLALRRQNGRLQETIAAVPFSPAELDRDRLMSSDLALIDRQAERFLKAREKAENRVRRIVSGISSLDRMKRALGLPASVYERLSRAEEALENVVADSQDPETLQARRNALRQVVDLTIATRKEENARFESDVAQPARQTLALNLRIQRALNDADQGLMACKSLKEMQVEMRKRIDEERRRREQELRRQEQYQAKQTRGLVPR
ncbi:MAG: hypothetical protein NXI18_13175 [Alphaproteobacteria bacterium]|nr:hypothetical protein [Alphaproteobacteria bacterium]